MTNEEVIARLSKENIEIKDQLMSYEKAFNEISSMMYCIGGPLNDNVLEYTPKQLETFYEIKNAIDSVYIPSFE